RLDGHPERPGPLEEGGGGRWDGVGEEQQLGAPAGGERLLDPVRSLDEELPVALAHPAPVQLPCPLDQPVAGAGDHLRTGERSYALSRDAAGKAFRRATSTSASNARGSETARSARPFRSRSTPPRCSPSPNRL